MARHQFCHPRPVCFPKFGCCAESVFQDFLKLVSSDSSWGWMLCRDAIRAYCCITGAVKVKSVPVMSNVISSKGDMATATGGMELIRVM